MESRSTCDSEGKDDEGHWSNESIDVATDREALPLLSRSLGNDKRTQCASLQFHGRPGFHEYHTSSHIEHTRI